MAREGVLAETTVTRRIATLGAGTMRQVCSALSAATPATAPSAGFRSLSRSPCRVQARVTFSPGAARAAVEAADCPRAAHHAATGEAHTGEDAPAPVARPFTLGDLR